MGQHADDALNNLMGGDHEGDFGYFAPRRKPLRLAKEDLTCRSCGADCYWQEVVAGDGQIKPRLFENGKPHVCKPSADDFDVVTP